MITQELFSNEFERLTASFGRKLSSHHLAAWMEETEKMDPELFRKTCLKLKYGDSFPNFGTFRKIYQIIETQLGTDNQVVSRGCKLCHNGFILYEIEDHSFAAHCENCTQDTFGKHLLDAQGSFLADKRVRVIPKVTGDKFVPREAVRALFKLMASGQTDLADITPNEAIELAEGLEEAKPQYSEKDRARAANIWKSEKAEREATEFAAPF